MRIVNNTAQIINLVNGRILNSYSTIIVKSPTRELTIQVENLRKLGIVSAF